MKQETSNWLQAQRKQAHQLPLRPRHGLYVEGELIGSIEDSFAKQLNIEALNQHGLSLQWRSGTWVLGGAADLTLRLNQLAQLMRNKGLSGAWRDEQLLVCNAAAKQVATIERGAVRPLGIATRAVHLVGVCDNGAIWVQQRSEDKANNPGMWDTLMGGMVSAQDSLPEALARETWEEAGLHVTELAQVTHGGYVEFSRPSDEAEGQGYMVERIDWFSALVPEALTPVNQDGEVQRFERLAPAVVEDWLVQGRFTPEAALVLADYMGW
ncbi:NUDIX domain-containing protein [Comamonas sp. Y33R10-2]|uniref:NUDIX hydrolase n=1 Tax=Comamonas sp. Y33R10-2 TaxID=2853257 RepID=UPI001C5CB115|nr:NUDIX domain-containing protein [Comamonas sp. Y33R10-2]QXZ09996.1 NUDIX domain-containing protein [Comamonas sp. Y33R10-2]